MKDNQLVVFGAIIAFGIIFSVMFLTGGIIKYQKLQNQTITVTGSASEKVTSDFAVLNLTYKAQSSNLKAGYSKMEGDKEKIKKFLKENGIKEDDIKFRPVSYYEVYKRVGNYLSNDIEFYKFSSDVSVSSNDTKIIASLSEKITDLINDNIEIAYSNVEYFVSNLDELKIKMVGEATKNAKLRAKSMVKATGDNIGPLNSAKMGVFQITSANSTEVSDYGISDTTSIEKKVTAVVNATFTVK